MADLTTLLSKFLTSLYAGVMDAGAATLTLGSATSVTSVAAGTGTTTALVGGTLFSSVTSTSTVGTSEETLLSYTLPASTMAVNGRGVRVTAWGTTAANANSKTFRIYFGATVVEVQAGGASALPWLATAVILRASATTQVATGSGNFSGIVANTSQTSPGETLSGTVLIKVTGTTPTAGADITQTGLLIEAI